MKTENTINCFVCGTEIHPDVVIFHPSVHLPCCCDCRGTEQEKLKVAELLDGLAEGLVCGCI